MERNSRVRVVDLGNLKQDCPEEKLPGHYQLVVEDDSDTDSETPRMSSTKKSIHKQSVNYLVNP